MSEFKVGDKIIQTRELMGYNGNICTLKFKGKPTDIEYLGSPKWLENNFILAEFIKTPLWKKLNKCK